MTPIADEARKPKGGAESCRSGKPCALNASLLERVLERENLLAAWKRVRANQGAAGVDAMSIADFPAFVRDHWEDIRAALGAGAYRPQPVRRVHIPKPAGGKRPLGIPTVLDRVIQQAIAQVLEPVFDPGFSERSFGFRRGRSAHDALRRVQADLAEGYAVAVDMDLSKFFDTVNHDLLMNRVARKVGDRRLLKLIWRYLRAGVEEDGVVKPTIRGVPQGGPLSPLLANILLDDLDRELEKRGHRFARYADDFLVLVRTPRAGERVAAGLRRFLEKRLRLTVNEKKSKVAAVKECGFLGFTFRGKKIRWTDEALRDFKHRVIELTGRSWGVAMTYRLRKLSEYLRGWMGYYALSEYYRPLPDLDSWIRRRIRMCYWKQWRRTRTRVRELLKLGTSPKQAILTALSRKSYWHLSKTLATQSGLTDNWLDQQGLVSVRKLWIAFHYPAPSCAG
jgi:RNA-directed DNA polymerase